MFYLRRPGSRAPGVLLTSILAVALLSSITLLPGPARAGEPIPGDLHATLDGKALDLDQVGRYYCHDFTYPEIRCFSTSATLEDSLGAVSLSPTGPAAASSGYVTIYDATYYWGNYMLLSQDYAALAWIGWNDRIRSFIVHGSYGRFWTDWFYGGDYYGFCCNQQYGWLGVYDRTFSSVQVN